MEEKYLRAKQVSELLSIGESTVWLYSKQGILKPIRLTKKVTIWKKSDIEKLIEERIKADSGENIEHTAPTKRNF